jgi:AcrR family transcriptional regulator
MGKKGTLSKLRQREREVREDLIIDAARTVFGSKTYDKVSMQEIANAAGIAKSSIYTYFANQEALFVEAAYRDTQRFIAELETRLKDKDDSEKLETLIAHFLEYNTRNEVYWQMITRFSLYGEIGGESSRKLDVVARRFMDLLDLVFADAPAGTDKRLLSHTLFASLSGILIAFRKYPGRSEAESLAHMQRVGRLIEDMFDGYLGRTGDTIPAKPEG